MACLHASFPELAQRASMAVVEHGDERGSFRSFRRHGYFFQRHWNWEDANE